MSEERPRLDLERQAQARIYARLGRRASMVETALGLAYLLAWVGTAAAVDLIRSLSPAVAALWPATLLVTAACLGVPWFLITLPFGYYTGFALPRRFGQSNQTLGAWVVDLLKGIGVGAVLGVPLLLGLYAVMRLWPETWWAIAGVGYLAFVVLMAILAPVVLMPLFNRYRPLGEDRADLVERLTRLAAAAGRRVRGVYTFDLSRRTRSANAALVGLGQTRRIILGDTLLDEFPPEEIEAVLAHELGHDVHRDIPIGVLASTVVTMLTLWVSDIALLKMVAAGTLTAVSDPAGLPILLLVFSLVGLVTSPLQNGLSRWRERRADVFSLDLTRRPRAFADAMTRLANQNLADANPPRWAVILFGTHPPLEERIRRANRFVVPE